MQQSALQSTKAVFKTRSFDLRQKIGAFSDRADHFDAEIARLTLSGAGEAELDALRTDKKKTVHALEHAQKALDTAEHVLEQVRVSLKGIKTENRITRLTRKLADIGVVYSPAPGLLSFQKAAELEALVNLHIPKKADSRVALKTA